MPAPITPAEARRLDANAEDLGVPIEALMDHAGSRLADALADRVGESGDPILLLCGKGNNGGDGLAAAAHLLARGHDAWVVLAEDPSFFGDAAQSFLARLPEARWTVWSGKPEAGWNDVPVVADCLLGAGLRGPLRPPYKALASWTNAARKKGAFVVACDVPTGLGQKGAVRPDETVTLHAPKPSMTRANSGRITVADIGIPDGAADIGPGDLEAGYVQPRADSHKGDNGRVLVVAGSLPYTGAPRYCAMGALRTGADLVHLIAPGQAAPTIRAFGPEAIVHEAGRGAALDADAVDVARSLLRRSDVLLVGPGLGSAKSTRQAVEAVLQDAARLKVPCVVDADGLDAVTPAILRRHGQSMVLTPHAREFRDLAGQVATTANVQAYARQHGVTVLCKGRVGDGYATLVTDGKRTRECWRGHPTLTVGGTGDVLAGALAALIAKGASPFDAACAAAYLVASAGELAASLLSYGATATDLHETLPSVLVELEAKLRPHVPN